MGTGQKKLKEGGNRRECKLKAERNERAEARCSHITGNKLHRQKQQSKSTQKEKRIIKKELEQK